MTSNFLGNPGPRVAVQVASGVALTPFLEAMSLGSGSLEDAEAPFSELKAGVSMGGERAEGVSASCPPPSGQAPAPLGIRLSLPTRTAHHSAHTSSPSSQGSFPGPPLQAPTRPGHAPARVTAGGGRSPRPTPAPPGSGRWSRSAPPNSHRPDRIAPAAGDSEACGSSSSGGNLVWGGEGGG